MTTLVATGAATLGWLLIEKLRDGHATSLGAASGVVAGLVAITPACSSVTPVGAILVGLVAGVDGLFYGGGVDQLWRQAVGAFAVLAYSFVLTYVIGFIIQKTMGFRISEEDEVAGIDSVVHAETAYDFASLGGSGGASLSGQAHAEARNTEGATRA